MTKSRVPPLKQESIPRLELKAAVLAVKVDQMLKTEMHLPLEQSTFWTDSTTVLSYIENESTRFETFVVNRVNFIPDATIAEQWHYVKTTENPADMTTRGTKIKNFKQKNVWLNGPKFLLQHQSKWLKVPIMKSELNNPEIKSIMVNTLSVNKIMHPLSKLIGYYSN